LFSDSHYFLITAISTYLIKEDEKHEIVPVINKVDLPAADVGKVKQQIEDVIGLDASNAIMISAKTGLGVPDVLEAIVTRLPPPKGDRDAPLKALLVDSWYDAYLGVVVLVRIVDGVLKKGQRIRMIGIDAAYEVDRTGVFTPKLTLVEELGPGEIGMLTASIKEVADHFDEVIRQLNAMPAVIGHSFGGLMAQILAESAKRLTESGPGRMIVSNSCVHKRSF